MESFAKARFDSFSLIGRRVTRKGGDDDGVYPRAVGAGDDDGHGAAGGRDDEDDDGRSDEDDDGRGDEDDDGLGGEGDDGLGAGDEPCGAGSCDDSDDALVVGGLAGPAIDDDGGA